MRALFSWRVVVAVAASCAFAAGGAAACATKNDAAADASDDAAGREASAAADARSDAEEDATVAGRDAGRVVPLGAMAQTSVLDAPAWPEKENAKDSHKSGSHRLGYLRHGAIVSGYEHTFANDECKEGWYELESGGYVCSKAATTEVSNIRVRLAPKQPDRDAGLPYRYGVNLSDGTPLYRKALTTDERKKYEPWLVPVKAEAKSEDGEEKPEKAEKGEGSEDEAAPATPSRKGGPVDAGVDASKPKLRDFKGKGVLVRKMAHGFYLGLDKEFRSAGARWWRTSLGFAVPHERIMLQQSTTKHLGTWFGELSVGSAEADAAVASDAAPVAAVSDAAAAVGDAGVAIGAGSVGFVNTGFARKIEIGEDLKKLTWGAELPKRTAVMLTGREAVVSGQTYHHTTSGFWVRVMDLKMARPAPPPGLKPNEKWIDVDLTRQALVAFEGTKPVFGTLISSGRRNPQDKEKDFPTPTGTFRIKEKHVTTTMDGDVASDGPYSIEDVPWVMYFQGSYALHGAFWHDAFGHLRSHGCVNMAPEDARTLFHWADPVLPASWHGVFAKDDAGTRIVIHEDPPERRR